MPNNDFTDAPGIIERKMRERSLHEGDLQLSKMKIKVIYIQKARIPHEKIELSRSITFPVMPVLMAQELTGISECVDRIQRLGEILQKYLHMMVVEENENPDSSDNQSNPSDSEEEDPFWQQQKGQREALISEMNEAFLSSSKPLQIYTAAIELALEKPQAYPLCVQFLKKFVDYQLEEAKLKLNLIATVKLQLEELLNSIKNQPDSDSILLCSVEIDLPDMYSRSDLKQRGTKFYGQYAESFFASVNFPENMTEPLNNNMMMTVD